MRTTLPPLLLGLALLASSCVSYDLKPEAALEDLARGDPVRAAERLEDPDVTGSEFLSDVEVGTLAVVLGDWERAHERLTRAVERTKEEDRASPATPEALGETLVRWALTEQVGPYRPEGYERVMLHSLLAMTYLARGRAEGARVEVRRADDILTADEKLFDRTYAAGGLGHFVSALSYELEGRLDDALIDYARMMEKGVGREVAGPALLRHARLLGRAGEFRGHEEKWGPPETVPEGSAKVVVIAGVGLGPVKREIRVDVPTGEGLVSWAVPDFVGRPQAVRGLELSTPALTAPFGTRVIEDVTHAARENLKDRILWLTGRTAVRNALKLGLARYLDDKWGDLGVVVAALITWLTERADLRCWHTLPDTWQACRAFLPEGAHRLTLRAVGGETTDLGTFLLLPGETVLVFARTAGGRVYAHVVGGRRVAEEMGRGAPGGLESTLHQPSGAKR